MHVELEIHRYVGFHGCKWNKKYCVKEVLCISDAESQEAAIVMKYLKRFDQEVTDRELARRKIERIPENTRRSTKWGVKVWLKWVEFRKDTIQTMTGIYKMIRSFQSALQKNLTFGYQDLLSKSENKNVISIYQSVINV